jgi:hypothetical protein
MLIQIRCFRLTKKNLGVIICAGIFSMNFIKDIFVNNDMPELMTERRFVKCIASNNYTNVISYNFDSAAWNVQGFWDIDTKMVCDAYDILKSGLYMDGLVPVVMSVMTVNRGFYPGFGEIIRCPRGIETGGGVLGNVFVRDIMSGRLIRDSVNNWIGVGSYSDVNTARTLGGYSFASSVLLNRDFREKVINICQRVK